ncbi:Mitochondrial carrier protein [Phytophthora infestans]|uniref:Mitochondrial carrier protein n=1 Tax=Phytophthora infestans TaxID=4787 RepID=A0A833W959_PHYIN|nr:Mitochondrial carrier protein [Phytophthora infestans]KAF4127269.1 Mitochondrial carrier protein [Phytophthora infestans]
MNETMADVLLLGCYSYGGLPFNVVTLRLQTQSHRGAYRGSILSSKAAYAIDGVPKKVVAMLELQNADSESVLTPQMALESSASSFVASTVTTVPDNIACKLQFQRGPLGHGVYRGPLDCMAKIFRVEGVAGRFRGYSSVLLRDVPLVPIIVGAYHVTTSNTQRIATRYTGCEYSLTATVVSTSLAVATGLGVLYPADVVKAHMQTTSALSPPTLRESFRWVYMQYGLRGFYRGCTAAVVGASLSFTAFTTAYLYITPPE